MQGTAAVINSPKHASSSTQSQCSGTCARNRPHRPYGLAPAAGINVRLTACVKVGCQAMLITTAHLLACNSTQAYTHQADPHTPPLHATLPAAHLERSSYIEHSRLSQSQRHTIHMCPSMIQCTITNHDQDCMVDNVGCVTRHCHNDPLFVCTCVLIAVCVHLCMAHVHAPMSRHRIAHWLHGHGWYQQVGLGG